MGFPRFPRKNNKIESQNEIKLCTIKVFMQRNFTLTFYGLSVKIPENGLVASFIEIHYLASFLRNFALNDMQISYL